MSDSQQSHFINGNKNHHIYACVFLIVFKVNILSVHVFSKNQTHDLEVQCSEVLLGSVQKVENHHLVNSNILQQP